MDIASRWLEFVYLPGFLRSIKNVLDDDELRELESVLCRNPETGSVMVGTGGVRKVRWALPGKGKSSGLRVIYFYRGSVGRIYLLLAYPKNIQDNLTAVQKSQIKELTAQLAEET